MPDFDLFPASMFSVAFAERAIELADALKEQWLDVAMAGPIRAAKVASKVEEASRGGARTAEWLADLDDQVELDEDGSAHRRDNAWRSQRLMQDYQAAAAGLSSNLTDFIALAQSALDDDGSRTA